MCVGYNHLFFLYHATVSFTPSSSEYWGVKPKSLRAGVVSHTQLRWLIMLYLSRFTVDIFPIKPHAHSATTDIIHNNQLGKLIDIASREDNDELKGQKFIELLKQI